MPPLKRAAKVGRGGASRAALGKWDDAVGKPVSEVSSGFDSAFADCLPDTDAKVSKSAKRFGIEAPKGLTFSPASSLRGRRGRPGKGSVR